MKIQHAKEIETFFQRCIHNIQTDQKNQFLNAYVTEENEKQVIRQLKKAGFAEWNKQPQPSLFLSADEWENSPYHKTIHLEHIQDEHFTFEKEMVYGNELFNADVIQKDPNRELNDYMKLRAMDRDFQTIYLLQDEEDWMMDVPSEAITNDPYAKKAHGNIVTFGLGIGYFTFMAMQNPNVTSITIVERSPQVISMFQKHILPQFPIQKPIHFVQEDAFSVWNETFLKQFDYIYCDIWQSNDDGLQCITKLLEQYNPPFEDTDFWIEDSCFEILWTLSLLYFKQVYEGKRMAVAPHAKSYFKKIETYYSKKEIEITSVDELKHLMYDTRTLREILAVNVRA